MEYVNYKYDPLKQIAKFEAERIRAKLAGLNQITKLCQDAGKSTVAEYGFKGTLKNVRKQLFELRERFMKKGMKESDRAMLIKNQKRFVKHIDSEINDVYTKAMREKRKTDMSAALDYVDLIIKRNELLHKKKECICYCNGVYKNVKRKRA